MKNRVIVVASCLAIIIIILLYWVWQLVPTPMRYSELTENKSVDIRLSQDRVLFTGDCVQVSWAIQSAETIALNGNAVDPDDAQQICDASIIFVISLANGTSQTIDVSPDVLMQSGITHLLIWIVALSTLVGLGALGGFFSRQRWREDRQVFWRDAVSLMQQLRASDKVHKVSLAAIIVLGIVFRVVALARELRVDEILTYTWYTADVWQAIAQYDDPNNHLLNTLIIFVNKELFGTHVLALRIHVFLVGISVVPLSYIVGRLYYNPAVGLGTAALVAGGQPMLWYTSVARGYIIQTALFLLLLILAHHILRKRNAVSWLLLAMVTALSFFALVTTVYMYLGFSCWLLITLMIDRKWHEVGHWVAFTTLAAWLTILFYLPTLTSTGLQPIIANEFVELQSQPDYFASQAPQIVSVLLVLWSLAASPLLVWLAIGLGAGVIGHTKMARHRVSVLLVFIVVLIPVIIIQQVVPFPRVWTFLFPIVMMTVVVGWLLLLRPMLGERSAKFTSLFAVMIALLFGVFSLVDRWQYYGDRTYHCVMNYLDLHDEAAIDNRLLTHFPVREGFEFYFTQYGVPRNRLNLDGFDALGGDIFILIEERWGETIETVLDGYDAAQLDPEKFVLADVNCGDPLYVYATPQNG